MTRTILRTINHVYIYSVIWVCEGQDEIGA